MIRDMIATDHLPDYRLAEAPGDILCVTRRAAGAGQGPDRGPEPGSERGPLLRAETLEAARRLAPGQDIYAREAEWRALWQRTGRPRLRSADAAFLGWLRKAAAS
jgi:hypothetical protein